MAETVNIGVVGDYEEGFAPHLATNKSLYHSAKYLSVKINIEWIPTQSLLISEGRERLKQFDGIWAAPGSPYKSLSGALKGIQFAREQNQPFLGTCRGFQHTLLEYARNVLGIEDAGYSGYDVDTTVSVIVLASCPIANRPKDAPLLWGKLKIRVSLNSLAFRIYQKTEVKEDFGCNYELNSAFQEAFEAKGLCVTGVGQNGEARIIELMNHRFFLATAFRPQFLSQERCPHPVITAYLEAASRKV